MNPPRTLLISPFFDAALPSGGVLYSMDVARGWLRRGREVAVLCDDRVRLLGDLQSFADSGQLQIHAVSSVEQTRFTHHSSDEVAARSRTFIDEYQPAIIHVHNTHGLLSAIEAAAESAAPVILTALDFGMLCFNFYLYDGSLTPCCGPESAAKCAVCVQRTLHGVARWMGPMLPQSVTRRIWPRFVRLDQIKSAGELQHNMRSLVQSFDAVIAPSPIVAEQFSRYGARGVVEILYGIAPEKMVRPAKEPAAVIRLAYLGSAEPIKGLQVLLAAAEQMPDDVPVEIRAWGGSAIREAIDRSSPRVRRYLQYHPPLFGRALAEAHAHIDALLVPSLWHENSPFVVLESLANGTPVFASDQAGIRHLIRPGENGMLIEPGNVSAWAQAFLAAADEPGKIKQMQKAAQFQRTTADFVTDVEELEQQFISRPQPDPLIHPFVTASRIIPIP